MGKVNVWLLWFVVLGLGSSCSQSSDIASQHVLFSIAHQRIALQCQLDSLHRVARQTWDNVADSLQQQLPVSMPVDERYNMIHVRNEALIKMFMVYDSLPETTQFMVEAAGEKDSLLNVSMRGIQKEVMELEKKIDSVLHQVRLQKTAQFESIYQALRAIEQQSCSSK